MPLIKNSLVGLLALAISVGNAGASDIEASQSGSSFAINTISTAMPNTVRKVKYRCPRNGELWAVATGRLAFDVTSNNFPGTVAYSLTRNSTSMQSNHQQNIFGRYLGNFATMPFAIQRVDRCKKNQQVVYRLLATRGTFTANFKV